MRELGKYNDVLDLMTVFAWRDEVGIKRGVLYEDGKVEFEKWPLTPHENIVKLFEGIFNRQFYFPWPSDVSSAFEGIGSQGKVAFFLRIRLMMLDTNLPGKKNQPDSTSTPNTRFNANTLFNYSPS